MSDKLKQFVEENRAAFDSELPTVHLFDKLRERMGHKKPFSLRRMMARAAVIIGLISAGALLFYMVDRKVVDPSGNTIASSDEYVDYLDPLYARQINQFETVIDVKQSQLKQLEKDHPQLYKEFVEDISRLDSAYRELQTDLPENPNKEVLLDAMLQNLQLQSELLNRQLLIIKEIKQKSNSHEKSST